MRYPFLEALFCLCDFAWVAIVLSVRTFFTHPYMLLYSYTSHLYEGALPLDFVIGLIQIDKDGDRVFVHLESILNFLCEYIQWVFCGVATSEASLTWCDDIVVFEPPIQKFDNFPSLPVIRYMMSVMLAF